ncbi:Kinesin-like protein KIN-7L, partial [Dichanthelium oligosanthes]
MEKISVAVRFRPPNPTPTPAVPSSASGGGDREPHVFDGAATNARVYGAVVRSVIRAAIDGFNGTVFAYGQTSSGKTYTKSGADADPGTIPLAVRDLFDTACQAVDREFLFRVSYTEIYNEDINDLLTLGSHKLPICDSSEVIESRAKNQMDSGDAKFVFLTL